MMVSPRIGQRVQLWYRQREQMPYHGHEGVVEIRGKGPGPRNHGVRLNDGRFVVVPCGNLRKADG